MGRKSILFFALVICTVIGTFVTLKSVNPIRGKSTWIESFTPEPGSIAAKDWIHIPIGITVAWIPLKYNSEPIWTSIPYQKGPPEHFIGKIRFHLSSDLELSVDGPLTIDKTKGDADWKHCFESWFSCNEEKKKVLALLQKETPDSPLLDLAYFQNRNPEHASGVRGRFEKNNIVYDKVAAISPLGTFTVFTFKRPKALRTEADPIFENVISSLQVRNLQQLQQAQTEIALLIGTIRLQQIQQIKDLRARLLELSRAQVLLASNLSVSPNRPEPFFHFGGVSHLLGVQLLSARERIFDNQESWSNFSEPNLQAMAQYIGDFEKSTREQKNLEELIKDLAYQRQKLLQRR